MRKRKRPDRKTGLVREAATEYRAPRRLSATEAARNFSEILNRIRYRGESFVIERGGQAVCVLGPAAPTPFTGRDLVALLRSLPPVDEEYLDTVERIARSQPLLPEPPWAP